VARRARKFGTGSQSLETFENRPALRKTQPERDDLRLNRGVGITQSVAVLNAHQMSDETPGITQAFGHRLEGLDQTRPTRLEFRVQLVQANGQLREKCADTRFDVSRLDEIKARKRAEQMKRIRFERRQNAVSSRLEGS
jgi:hypothetical protein